MKGSNQHTDSNPFKHCSTIGLEYFCILQRATLAMEVEKTLKMCAKSVKRNTKQNNGLLFHLFPTISSTEEAMLSVDHLNAHKTKINIKNNDYHENTSKLQHKNGS
jgi:hypothetical protein